MLDGRSRIFCQTRGAYEPSGCAWGYGDCVHLAVVDGIADCMRACCVCICAGAAGTPMALCLCDCGWRICGRVLRRGMRVSEHLAVLRGAWAAVYYGSGRYGADLYGSCGRVPGNAVCDCVDVGDAQGSVEEPVVLGGALLGLELAAALGVRDCDAGGVLGVGDVAGGADGGLSYGSSIGSSTSRQPAVKANGNGPGSPVE